MKTRLTIVCIIVVVVGLYLNFDFYQSTIHPLNLANNHLSDIATSSDHAVIQTHLVEIKQNLPEEGNPVWIFPTETTNFARLQSDLDVMIVSVEKISAIPRDSSAFYTGMLDVKVRAEILKENIEDVTPYMYVSVSNIVLTSIWIAGILGIFALLKRKKEQLKAYDASEDV